MAGHLISEREPWHDWSINGDKSLACVIVYVRIVLLLSCYCRGVLSVSYAWKGSQLTLEAVHRSLWLAG